MSKVRHISGLKRIIFRILYRLAMIRFFKKIILPLLHLLDYCRVIDINWLYTEDYFNLHLDTVLLKDVELISEIIYRKLKPKNVIDVGCGVGAYLYYLSKLGVEVWGIEGSDAAFRRLMIPKNKVKKLDLRFISFYSPKRIYDLAMCIEVLEHINPKHADKVLDFLCEASDTVLITAAPPGQGGTYHINEQPPEYWISRMRVRGYRLDPFITSEIRKEMAGKIKKLTYIIKNIFIFRRVQEKLSY